MKTTHAALVLLLGAALAACGGGGGGGGGAQPPANPPTNPPPAGSTGASAAKFLFPAQRSSALGAKMIVRGTATDPDGVAGVRVNGVVATLSPSTQGGSPKIGSAVQKTSPFTTFQAGEGDVEVEWSAEVELTAGENALVVSVEDGTGETTAAPDEITVKYAEVPLLFASDADSSRLIGWSSTLVNNQMRGQLAEYDYVTQTQTVYPEFTDIGVYATCFRSHENEFVYLLQTGQDEWHVRTFDLGARVLRDVADVSALLAADPGFTGPQLMQLVCGAQPHAYLGASYVDSSTGSVIHSRVLEIALSGGASVLTETDPTENPLWRAYKMALAGNVLVTAYEINDAEPLTLPTARAHRTARWTWVRSH